MPTIAIDSRKLQDFGIGTYVRNLIVELAELDRQTRYLLIVGPQAREALPPLPDNFVPVLERAPVYSVRELLTLSWRLARQGVDLYHATHYILPVVVPGRAVVTIHDIIHLLYPEYLPHRLAYVYAERMIRRSLVRGDRIVAVSQNTKADLMRHFGVDGRKIEVVYNGIDEVFRREVPPAAREAVLARYEIAPPYLLFVGNPKPHKNLDRIVQAYARALELHDFPHRLVAVGDRDAVEFKIRQRARQIGIEDRVHLLGHVPQDDLPALYQAADLFLYPTLYEGFGLPVVEAMASGVAVVTSNTSALKEIAAGYAHLVNPLDVEAMARAIVQCLRDDEHRESLRKLGRRRAQDFRCRRAAERTLDIYRQVLDAGARTDVPTSAGGDGVRDGARGDRP